MLQCKLGHLTHVHACNVVLDTVDSVGVTHDAHELAAHALLDAAVHLPVRRVPGCPPLRTQACKLLRCTHVHRSARLPCDHRAPVLAEGCKLDQVRSLTLLERKQQAHEQGMTHARHDHTQQVPLRPVRAHTLSHVIRGASDAEGCAVHDATEHQRTHETRVPVATLLAQLVLRHHVHAVHSTRSQGVCPHRHVAGPPAQRLVWRGVHTGLQCAPWVAPQPAVGAKEDVLPAWNHAHVVRAKPHLDGAHVEHTVPTDLTHVLVLGHLPDAQACAVVVVLHAPSREGLGLAQ